MAREATRAQAERAAVSRHWWEETVGTEAEEDIGVVFGERSVESVERSHLGGNGRILGVQGKKDFIIRTDYSIRRRLFLGYRFTVNARSGGFFDGRCTWVAESRWGDEAPIICRNERDRDNKSRGAI